MQLFDDPVLDLVHRALEENKVLVIALSALLTFLVLRFVHKLCFLDEDDHHLMVATNGEDHVQSTHELVEIEEKAILDDCVLLEAFQSGAPPKDPIHSFMDGERDKMPFMCPFFEAFKMAQKRADKEREEDENIARAQRKEKQHELLNTKCAAEGEMKPAKSAILETKSTAAPIDMTPEIFPPEEEEKLRRDPAELRNVLNSVPFSHLPGCLKRQEQGKMFATMSDPDRVREREAVADQLKEVFALLAQQKEAVGDASIEDVYSQMKLYGQ